MAKITSVRLSDDLVAKLDQLASAMDRPRAWVIGQAITRYVQEEAWQVAAIREALDDYRAGKSALKSHQEVMERLEQKLRARAKFTIESPLA